MSAVGGVVSDTDPALSALTTTTPPTATLLRGADLQRPVPHLEWTIGDLGAHMVSVVRAYTMAAQGRSPIGPDLWKIDENNARLIAETPETSAPDLADALETESAAFVAASEPLPRGQQVPFYGDVSISAGAQAGMLLGDRLVHWWDVATALGQQFSADSELALPAVAASFEVMPEFLVREAAKGFTATYEIRIRGLPPRFLVFDDGALTVSDQRQGRVDCRISADAMAYVLMALRRGSRWRPILRREVVISGKRPWLALKLEKLVQLP
jgi:uncharacterized protein (TIGR03083 family)